MPTVQFIHDHGIRPPTLIKTNEFTAPFQEIVNTYGIPNYKEVNPAVFAIVTFPFEYGIMFGDIGHGCFFLTCGLLLCLFSDQLKKYVPSLEGVLYARYLFLLMGLFAAFCGLMYNDFVSIPLFLFGDSCYPLDQRFKDGEIDNSVEMVAKDDCVYPIGIDPAWYLTPNELTFLNSLKMKVSVIVGVS
mmetsp:Transcript_7390/g.6650  ORF Transcript_7390/g.6650 Transcript_7390/m.6650 type:complete len:188 (+) Transcript_7390:541-1104(+)